MSGADALVAALAMLDSPRAARLARSLRMPGGIAFLLEIAAGEPHALAKASTSTGRSEAVLKDAASFFIEQVLLQPGADSYRVLGGNQETPNEELRRNMALLMRWLHPDLVSNGAPGGSLDRSLYASRVTRAWESIKTPERRAAYTASLPAKERKDSGSAAATKEIHLEQDAARGKKTRRRQQLAIYRFHPHDLWSRILVILGGRR